MARRPCGGAAASPSVLSASLQRAAASLRVLPLRGLRVRCAAGLALAIAAGCSTPRPEPLRLEGNRLMVFNDTNGDWTDVEIWLNRQFRLTVPKIAHGAPFTAPLDVFVAGFGQRFDFTRMQIRDLQLKAKNASGDSFELKKEFAGNGLEGALRGFGGKQ